MHRHFLGVKGNERSCEYGQFFLLHLPVRRKLKQGFVDLSWRLFFGVAVGAAARAEGGGETGTSVKDEQLDTKMTRDRKTSVKASKDGRSPSGSFERIFSMSVAKVLSWSARAIRAVTRAALGTRL